MLVLSVGSQVSTVLTPLRFAICFKDLQRDYTASYFKGMGIPDIFCWYLLYIMNLY